MGNKGMLIAIKDKKYEIIKNLGEGGFGRVILVKDKLDNKPYAIKEIIIRNETEYEIKKELGKGGFGRVFQVLNKSDNKYYAIKEIEIIEDMKDIIKYFEAEADFLSKFDCKNIVKYYDSYKDNNKFYIVMEYCEGQTLRALIDKNKKKNELIEEDILYNIIK